MLQNGEWLSLTVGDCDIPPEFIRASDCKIIKFYDAYYSAGKWMLKIKRDKEYPAVNAQFKYEKKSEKESKLLCVLRQFDASGEEISGDYFAKNNEFLNISLELSDNTDYITFEFLFYSFGKAELKIYPDNIEFVKSKPHRVVNVATTCFKRKFTNDCNDNLEEVLGIIDKASKDKLKPDIILFTETTYDRGLVNCDDHKWIDENSEPVKKICEKAKETTMYVIFGIHELDGKRKYNTDLLISPEGEVVGKYRKTHLVYQEVDDGMIPGDELKVFDLPFGRIGIIICWDQWFPDAAGELARKGAEIIFVSTAGNPECIYRSRAYENGTYVVVSGTTSDDNMRSFIIDQTGNTIAKVPDGENGYVVSQIDLDEHKYLEYLSFRKGYGANLYPSDRRPYLYCD